MNAPAVESAPPGRAHHLLPAALVAAAVALLVVLPELLGALGRLAAVLVLQLGLVLAWALTTGIQGFAGSLALGAGAAVAADLALVLPPRGTVGGLLLVLGLGFLAAVLQQMSRRPRPDLVASLSGGALLLSVIGALAALLLTGRPPTGPGPAVVAILAVGSALVAGHLVDSVFPRPVLAPGVPRGLLGVAASVLAGAAVAFAVRGLGETAGSWGGPVALASGAVLGLVAALTALAAGFVLVEATANGRWAPAVIQAALPLAACAPLVLAVQAVVL